MLVAFIAAPVVVALAATALTRKRWPANGPWMAVIGVVLACGYVLLVYLKAPLSSARFNGCSDCSNYGGHWWEPNFVILIATIGYLLWVVGVGLGIVAAEIIAAVRLRRRRDG